MAFEESNIRVNGSQLQAHMGSDVLLVGKGVQSGNMTMKMEACDGQVIDVKLQQQVDGNIACCLEVVGTVTGGRSLSAKEVFLHPEWDGVFDMETYNSTLETIHSDKSLQEYVLGMH